MPKEQFQYPETKPVFDLIEEASRRSGVSRAQAFEDFLHMGLCALSGGQMEEQYMQTVQKHTAGKQGKRGCDSIAQAFGALVDAMEKTRTDILGDIFQGAITYGEAGQFMTPEPVCQMMARMTMDGADENLTGRRTVCDPCCGSGRMLLAAADIQPHWDFIGQDVDLRCVRMTAINLALRNLYGHVIWGNSLKTEPPKLVYKTGFNLRGFVREVPFVSIPDEIQSAAAELDTEIAETADASESPSDQGPTIDESPRPKTQLRLF